MPYRLKFSPLAALLFAAAALSQRPAIEIEGAPGELEDNIRAHITIDREKCGLSPARLNILLRETSKQIHRAAQALGYYRLVFDRKIERDDKCWTLKLQIRPGEPVTIDRVQVSIAGEGREDPRFGDYLAALPVRSGQQLNHSQYEAVKSRLAAIAASRGYFDASFTRAELRVDSARNSADILLEYHTGVRYRYGEIRFSEIPIADKMLERFLTFETGEPYAVDQLYQLQQRLTNSKYFSRVAVRPVRANREAGRVPVEVALTMRKKYSFTTGVGMTTDTGPRGRFAFENRYVNRRGHRLNLNLTLSPVRSQADMAYTIPLRKPDSDSLILDAGYLTEDTDTSESDAWKVGVRHLHLTGNGWLRTYFLNYQQEDYLIADERQLSQLLLPGITWSRTVADDPVYPAAGWRFQAKLQVAAEGLLSDNTLGQFYTQGKFVHTLGPGRLLARMEAGYTWVDQFSELPPSLRYFAGGDASVRGYDYQTIGPVDEEGEVIGGQKLVTASLEYDFKIRDRWALATFVDAGSAYDDTIDLQRGVGIGVRWLSPLGPIRLDIANGLDDDNAWRIHITMGPDL